MSNPGKVLVSILMTAYNRDRYIAEAIESVLASSYTNFELIIVDDCSTDNTVAVAKNYVAKDSRVKVFVNETNLGQFANRNKAATLAEGAYLKFFDSDDVMHVDMLQLMIEGMQQFPDAALGVSCSVYKPEQYDYPIQFSSREAYIHHYFEGSKVLYMGPSGTIYRKDIFNSLGGFDETMGILADTLLSFKMAAILPVVRVKDDLFFWRIHDEQVTIGQQDLFEMVRDRYRINELALNSADCPFDSFEKQIVKRNLKNIFIRNFIKFVISIKSPVKIFQLYRLYRVTPMDIVKATRSNKILAASSK